MPAAVGPGPLRALDLAVPARGGRPPPVVAAPLTADSFATLLRAALDRAKVPTLGLAPLPIRGAYRDGAAVGGTTTVSLATYTVPAGKTFIPSRRVAVFDSSDAAAANVSGGLDVLVGGSVFYAGSDVAPGVAVGAGALAGEWLGPVAYDLDFTGSIAGGQQVELRATLVRGANVITATLVGCLLGYLIDTPTG